MIGVAKKSLLTAMRTPPPLRFVLSQRKKLKSDPLTRMLLSGTVSFNHVSVNTSTAAQHESRREERATFFDRTLRMLVYRKETPVLTDRRFCVDNSCERDRMEL